MKKITCFDLDKTLLFTPEPELGKKIFKDKTGLDYPHTGWWGRKETLDTNIFDIPLNPWVYKKYLHEISLDNNIVILATGRIEPLRKQVERLLAENNLSFEGVYLNTGHDTYAFKTKLFEEFINKYSPDRFTMYDDRQEHLHRFRQWAKHQKCEIQIIDVINKTDEIFN